jgi:hypothetical protein
MNRSNMAFKGFLVLISVLIAALMGSGCAPMPYQGPYYPEIIVVYEPFPVPYPVPDEVGGAEPLPQRKTPLKKPRNPGNPRIKTPRHDRSEDPPVIARGGGKPRQDDRRPSKKPQTRRR